MTHENWNLDESMSQKARVREWLNDGHSITQLEALSLFRSLRLSAIIFDLREEGMDIVTEMLQISPKKRVAKYYLKK